MELKVFMRSSLVLLRVCLRNSLYTKHLITPEETKILAWNKIKYYACIQRYLEILCKVYKDI